MEKINQVAFYDLGKAIRHLESMEGDKPAVGCYAALSAAGRLFTRLLGGDPLPLGVSRASAEVLRQYLDDIYKRHFTQDDGSGKTVFVYPAPNAPNIDSWTWEWARTLISKFEHVFTEEMREAATYYVPRRGIFYTPALVDTADETFPLDAKAHVPQKTREEWKSAGRCLAFNLLSASGFHVARAVEGMLDAYYKTLIGSQPDTSQMSWGNYISELENLSEATPCPSEKTLAEIRQMKDDYRNPLMHPRVVLSESDARMLFANGESLIIAMAMEVKEVQVMRASITGGAAISMLAKGS